MFVDACSSCTPVQSLLEGVEYRYQVPTRAAFTSTLDDVRHILDVPCDDGVLYKKIYRENKVCTYSTILYHTTILYVRIYLHIMC